MPSPPRRSSLKDELGLAKTPGSARETLLRSSGPDWLLLGLGPDPAGLAASLPPGARVRWLECPAFEAQCGPGWRAAIPPEWTRLEPSACLSLLERANQGGRPVQSGIDAACPADGITISLSSSSLRLFPGFWGPLLAALTLPSPAPAAALPTVLLPASAGRLLRRELEQALREEGFTPKTVEPGGLANILRQERPALYLSVNFEGLDDLGLDFQLLKRAGVPVAAWCVDNPFHALSRLKGLFWRDIHLFVTDAWFVEPLRRHGAASAQHLPLAACQSFFQAAPDCPQLRDSLLFVGRSGFPGREDYFAGLTPPDDLWRQALRMLDRGERPDYAWWTRQLGCEHLWPGKQARLAGLCAELSGQAWRAMVIQGAAAAGPLAVCGDERWRELAQARFELLPPVDYYGPLARMYASCRCVVGATSPLLPHGLTQRHFDVWAAGGCLVSDATPGLDIFPAELVREITFRCAGDIPEALRRAEADRPGLVLAWREHVAREHTYRLRVRTIIERVTP